MANLNAAAPHFIRCIKPNPDKAPNRYGACVRSWVGEEIPDTPLSLLLLPL